MERVGEARLAQDSQIQSRFLAGWNTTLNTNIMFATRARKNVENSRLSLDAVKARVKGTTFKLGHAAPAAGQEEPELSPEAQEEIEKAEDEFVTQTEEAVGVMKNVSDIMEENLQYQANKPGSRHPRASSQPLRAHQRPD